ncbi:MAG: DedA family protein [Calditrichaeota bacterium]|nr:DedA family protein [Calditrichota bacterium]
MEEAIRELGQQSTWWAYGLLFLSAFIENVFPPIPGDTVTLVGAYFVGTGKLNFWAVYFSTTAGSVLGFMTLYSLAYWLEWQILEKYRPAWIRKSHLDRVERWFRRYGYGIILANRFLSGARSVISIVAGLSRLNGLLVLLAATISVLLWNGLLIYLGAFIGKSWEEVVQYVKFYNKIILIGLGVLLLAYAIVYVVRRRKARTGEPD